ncbi:MAG: NUDIX domain-containing protein, partial [Actinobacteria bacterium]|nr:NUDIX domain-containing protein [Actinomycetota bacterium]
MRTGPRRGICFDRGSRALYATDYSIYRQVPIGIVVQKDADDIVKTVAAWRRHGAPVLEGGCGDLLSIIGSSPNRCYAPALTLCDVVPSRPEVCCTLTCVKTERANEHSRRHFTVAVFVVWEGKVLLHFHRKLGMWLPPGGHIERDELPDDAAVREVFEETGLRVELIGEKREDVLDPVQLHRPAGVQLENIEPGHQHIDLIYFAKPKGPTEIHQNYSEDKVGWYGPE